MTEVQKQTRNKTFRDLMIAVCAAIVNVISALPFSEKVDYLILGKQIILQTVMVFAFRYLRENKVDAHDYDPKKAD